MNNSVTTNYDSTFCGNLPIHLINVIQPYGALLVLGKEKLDIVQASVNVAEIAARDVELVVGSELRDYLNEDGHLLLLEKVRSGTGDKAPFNLNIFGHELMVILHHKEHYAILELNFDSAADPERHSFINVYQEVKAAISAIEATGDVDSAAKVTARELKKASGFDKVMIYRFDENWNGTVLAEEREPDMESYMDFTFPASDIPAQARALYLKNTYRFIPDRNYEPVRLYPVINPVTQTFIDMSDCNLRGVSAVHVEYLRNMGVVASMSTRILKGEQLWGLIACHHKTVKPMSFRMCATFELLSGIISSKINAVADNQGLVIINRLEDQYSRIIRKLYHTGRFAETMLKGNPGLADLFTAGGAAVATHTGITRFGDTPETHEIEDLLLWLTAKQVKDVFHTTSLGEHYDNAVVYKQNASGLLAIPLNSHQEGYLLVFRPEVIRELNWGGDPATRINFESDMKTYHPRFSFQLWREQVVGYSLPWKKEEIQVAEKLKNFVEEYLAKNDNN